MQNINQVLQSNPLVKLIQKENFVGWIYGIDYDTAQVMTNDLWKTRAMGLPHNCFLVATSFNPDSFSTALEADQQVILLRVVEAAKLPQNDELVRARVDHYQDQTGVYGTSEDDFDEITRNQMQFGGLSCRVLGTFYMDDGELRLGSDLEFFEMAARLQVYRPRGQALETIANYVDPIRRAAAIDEAQQLGIMKPIAPFEIGTVRYTSTDRLHRRNQADKVPVRLQPSDFLARRTAVLGMTRTGKSNMVKQLVSVVKRVADTGGVKIGQIIYDINGEYANANQQDRGSIADVYPNQTVRYRMLQTDGFEELQNNFYLQVPEGFRLICRTIEENKASSAVDVSVFVNMSLDEPDLQDRSQHTRWAAKVAAYKALLYRADFVAPANHRVKFAVNGQVQAAVVQAAGTSLPDPTTGITLEQAVTWFEAARTANLTAPLQSTSGKAWLDEETKAILNLLVRKNAAGTFIRGFGILADARKYHSPRRTDEVGIEIYNHLRAGKIVILDLSVGDPALRESLSKQIATEVFTRSMQTFIAGQAPPNIVVYVEEAHNLIGKGMDLTETWPRLAKEGAKYRIALVYATQEVTSIHPNILSNTENWVISHLNNENEIRELAKFYDFADFSRSLLRAQDVGFARVKTLSSPFVIPVQIDKFEPSVATVHLATNAQQGRLPVFGRDGA